MRTGACYVVAVLHAWTADAGPKAAVRFKPVHLFTLPADTVQARQHGNDLESAAGLAFELATADPAWLEAQWADLARGYRAAGTRTFHRGHAMVVLPPGGIPTVLRYAYHGWEDLGSVATAWSVAPGTRPGC